MTHIAIYGASPEDKTFFEQALKPTQANLNFLPLPLTAQNANKDAEVLSVFVDTPVTAEIIAAMPKLKLIACRSTGFDNIDQAAAKNHGVVVANVPNYGGVTVAEYTFTLLLMLSRHMPEVLNQSFSTSPNRERERGFDLSGKTMGILGTGSIGLGVAKIAKGFGMEILGFDLYPREEEAQKIGFTYLKDIDDVLCRSDVVSLHIPYTKENHHFLNHERFGKLKHGAIIINTARGELVDTTALVAALRDGHVSAAALDVLEAEYLMDPDMLIEVAAHDEAAKATLRNAVSIAALQRMPNVVVTNHNAFNTREALQRINQTTSENITNFLAGKDKEVHAV
jgi:D-lactate dehydrogenase